MTEPQPYEPNPILSWAYKRLFENIDVDPAWVDAIRECDKRGTVVYALRNLSFIDFLALDHLTKRFGLPQVKFAQHLGLGVLEPFGKGWFQTFSRKTPRGEESDLTTAIQADGSAILFLKHRGQSSLFNIRLIRRQGFTRLRCEILLQIEGFPRAKNDVIKTCRELDERTDAPRPLPRSKQRIDRRGETVRATGPDERLGYDIDRA